MIFHTLLGLLTLVASLSGQDRARTTIAVSPTNPLYLYAHFRHTDVVHLWLSYSSDKAISWQDVNPKGSFSAQALRDPSVMYMPHENPLLTGTFYFIVTPAVGTKVQFFSSADPINFSPITTIDITALVPGPTVAWAPRWWHDPRNGQYYFFIAVSPTRKAPPHRRRSCSPIWRRSILRARAPARFPLPFRSPAPHRNAPSISFRTMTAPGTICFMWTNSLPAAAAMSRSPSRLQPPEAGGSA